MFNTIFSAQKKHKQNDIIKKKRRFIRRSCDTCVSMINGKIYPVDNWSIGGLVINGDSRPFGIDNEIDITIKFKLREGVIDVPHKARVVRKTQDKVAFEFFPITKSIQDNFQNVVDDYVTNEFIDSQLT